MTVAIYSTETDLLQAQISELEIQKTQLQQQLQVLTQLEAIASGIVTKVADGFREFQQLANAEAIVLASKADVIERLKAAVVKVVRLFPGDSDSDSDTPPPLGGDGGVPPQPTPSNDPSRDSTPGSTGKNGKGDPAKVAIIPALDASHNGTKQEEPVHHNGQKHTLPEALQLSLSFEPGSQSDAPSAQFTPAEHQKNTDFDYPVISVEMTPEEQDVYALMGISPLSLEVERENTIQCCESKAIALDNTPGPTSKAIALDNTPSPTSKAIALDNTPSPTSKAIALDNTPSPTSKAIALDNTPSPTEESLVDPALMATTLDTESEVLPMLASSPVSALAIPAHDTEENLPIGEYPLSEVVEFVTNLETWFSIDESPIPGTLYLTSQRLTADTETATEDQREAEKLESKILDRFNKLAVKIENRNLITALEISGILLNQQELSAHLGVTPGTISSWKKKPNFVELSADRDPNGWGWTICPITKRCYPYSYPPANLLPEIEEKLYGMCSAEAYKHYIQTKFGHEQAALTLSDWGTMATDFSNLRSQNHTTISLKAVKKFLGENDQKNSGEKLGDNKSEPSPLKNTTPDLEEFPDLEDCQKISRVEFPDEDDCQKISRVEFPDLEDCDQISRVELLKRKLADLGYSEERIQDASIKTFGTRIEELNTEDLEIFESFLDEY